MSPSPSDQPAFTTPSPKHHHETDETVNPSEARSSQSNAPQKVRTPSAATTILIAVIAALIANCDRIYTVIKDVVASSASRGLSGSWYGTFRELDDSGKQPNPEASHEDVRFEPSLRGISGTLTATMPKARSWIFSGEYQQGVYIARYFGEADGRSGGVAYVLRGDSNKHVLKGYWIGTDPERASRIVVGPYVLTRANYSKDVNERLQGMAFSAALFHR